MLSLEVTCVLNNGVPPCKWGQSFLNCGVMGSCRHANLDSVAAMLVVLFADDVVILTSCEASCWSGDDEQDT
jgi:hypothetical protein